MAAVGGLEWPRNMPAGTTADAGSKNNMDRPIRPLPRRRLKTRLSDEQSESIVYPPVPPASSPVFDITDRDQRSVNINSIANAQFVSNAAPARADMPLTETGTRSDPESEEEFEDGNISKQRSTWSHAAISQSRSAAHYSATSSGDGYESFENTNNKKKRKIPQHQHGLSTQLLEDQASRLQLSPAPYQLDGAGHGEWPDESFYQAEDLSLSAEGRKPGGFQTAARLPKERQPMGTAPIAGNMLAGNVKAQSNTAVMGGSTMIPQAPGTTSTRRVLSQKSSSRPPKPENKSYDFTFERQSQSSDRLSQTARPVQNTQQTQCGSDARYDTTFGAQTGKPVAAKSQIASIPPQHQQQSRPPAAQAPVVEQPPPPSRTEQYRIAAEDRRRSQRATNKRQLREKKDVMLCEFCEFKAIWLYTPRFLIRRYEERDLKRRQDIDNRRRLLEKAKAKSRKTKKGAKGPRNVDTTQQPAPANQAPFDAAYDDEIAPEDAQSPGEEYFDDFEYDENGAHPDDYGDNVYGSYVPPLEPIPYRPFQTSHARTSSSQQGVQ